jgi:hypothetical protein
MTKFFLDGVEVESPQGWNEIKSILRRDDEIGGILLFQDSTITFINDGYDYLYSKLQDSFCNVVNLQILEDCEGGSFTQLLNGSIFVSDCGFNEKDCSCTAKIEDNSFFKSINNNKGIETSPFTDRTKNGETMITATTYNLDVYSTVNGSTLIRGNCQAVRVYEAFRVLIDFMTDGRVSFSSNTFGVGGTWEGLCITTGFQLRTATAAPFEQFSFEDLFKEVKARIPIGFKVLNPYSNPTIQIEALEDFYGSNTVFSFTDIYEIITTVDQQKLYAKINVGSSTINDSLTLPFPEDIDFFGFKTEEYFITGECNLDTTLELLNDWVISSNVIQSAAMAGSQDYDSDLFLIDSTLVDDSNGRTTNTDFLQVSTYFYNERLTNEDTIIRYIGFVPNSIANYLDVTGAGTFKAYLPANITHTATVAPDNDDYNPLALSAESYDVSAAYNTGTYRFTAPNAGVYDFTSLIKISSTTGVGSVTAYFQAYLRVFDSSNVLQDVGESFNGTIYGVRMFSPNTFLSGVPYIGVGANASNVTFSGSTKIVLRQGDYVILRFSKVGTTGDVSYTINAGSGNTYLECASNTLGGGVYETGEPSLYPVLVHSFEYPLSKSSFNNILNDTTAITTFAMNGQELRSAWIREIIYDHDKGVAQVKLFTDKTTQNAS